MATAWLDEISGVVVDAAFWWIGVEDSPVESAGDLSLEVSYKLRTLSRSSPCSARPAGRVRQQLHSRRTHQAALPPSPGGRGNRSYPHHLVSGCYEPTLDAIAAGDMTLVREIAELSPVDFRPPDEDGRRLLLCAAPAASVFLNPVPKGDLQPLLDRFSAYLNGDKNPRLQVCEALAARDAGAFAEAFENFLAAFGEDIQKNMARGQLEDVHVLAQRHVSVEGLAMLRLADRRGIPTAREYLFCPSLARVPASSPCPESVIQCVPASSGADN